jgi:hypothetical protein
LVPVCLACLAPEFAAPSAVGRRCPPVSQLALLVWWLGLLRVWAAQVAVARERERERERERGREIDI